MRLHVEDFAVMIVEGYLVLVCPDCGDELKLSDDLLPQDRRPILEDLETMAVNHCETH